MNNKIKGLVIKEMKYRDTSKILTIFTEELGKITIMARGACNPKSRLISNTELFFHNRYALFKGKTFYYINDTDTINSFYGIRENMDRLMYGSYMLELMDLSTMEGVANEKLFKLLLKGLEVLSELEEDFLKFIIAYEMKFISFLGYRPNFKFCVSCNSKTNNNMKFSIDLGGILCKNCFQVDKFSHNINEEQRKSFEKLLFSPLDKLGNIVINENNMFIMHRIMVKYILEKIDRKKFNSLNMYNLMQTKGVD